MSEPIRTRFLAPEEFHRWADLVAAAPAGSVYSLPEYLDALCAATSGNYRVLVAERDGRIAGGIALYAESGRVSPRSLLYYNGLVLAAHDARTPAQQTEWQLSTMEAIERALSELPHARVRFKTRPPQTDLRPFAARGWRVSPEWTYVVELDDLPSLWSRVHKDQQRLIRRCRERGVQTTMDDDFDSFFDLHLRTHLRKGAPLYLPRDAFRAYVETLRQRGLARLYHARGDGVVLATQLVLTGPHPVTHTVCAAAHPDHLSSGASAFLRWSVFEHLAKGGYRANDLTDAALNPVTRFKAQLGGQLQLCLETSRRDALPLRARETATRAAARLARPLLKRVRARRGNPQA